jgi:hypothetical protein
MEMVGDTRIARPSSTMLVRIVGSVVTALGVASVVVLAVQPSLDVHVGVGESIYSWYQWAVALAVIAAGLGIGIGGREVRVASAVVGAVASAQLAGVGLVARGKWFAYFGPIGGPVQNHEKLEDLALTMTICCAAAVLICIALLRAERCFSLRATPVALRLLLPLAGIAVAVVVPYMLTIGDNGTDAKTLLALAAMYGVPWGASVAASAWLRRPAATAAVATVGVSAAVAAFCDSQWTDDFGRLLFMGTEVGAGLGLAATTAMATLVVRLAVDSHRTRPCVG